MIPIHDTSFGIHRATHTPIKKDRWIVHSKTLIKEVNHSSKQTKLNENFVKNLPVGALFFPFQVMKQLINKDGILPNNLLG